MLNVTKTGLLSVVIALLALHVPAPVHAEGPTTTPAAEQTENVSLNTKLFQPWKTKYMALTSTAASALQSKNPENYAGQLHLLEVELVQLLKLSATDKTLSQAQRQSATTEARALLTQLQWNYPSLQGEMRTRFEAASPGKSGAQLVSRKATQDGRKVDVFSPSFKQSKRLSAAKQAELSNKLIAEHKAEHPGKSIHQQLTSATVPFVKSGELLEWVVVPNGKKAVANADGSHGELRVTRNAKHVVTSGGQDTLAAGSLKVIWHPDHPGVPEKALAVFASNWSGTFQPDMASLQTTMVNRLTNLNFPLDRIVLTTTMPLEPKLYEILLGMRKSKTKVTKSLARLALRADRVKAATVTQWKQTVKSSSTSPATPAKHVAKIPARLKPTAKMARKANVKRVTSKQSARVSKSKSPRARPRVR